MQRVLIHVNNLGLGGTQINAVDLAAATTEFGFESVVVGPEHTLPAEGPSLVDVAAARRVRLDTYDRKSLKIRGATTLTGAHTLSRLASRHRADIVHVYSTGFNRAAYWGPCLFGTRPLVITVYEMEIDTAVQERASLIVGTKYLHEEQEARPGPTELISPPVDLDRDNPDVVSGATFRAAHNVTSEQTAVVIVSRLDEEMKSFTVEVAMRAADALSHPAVVLVVVGTGTAAERLNRQAAAINSRQGRQAVIMAGPASDPRAAYSAADVVIGMGGSAARGLAFGKPLIVSGELGQFRTFRPGNAAALYRNSFWSNVPSANADEELLGCLRPLLDSEKLREELGRFGRIFAAENFGLRTMARKLSRVYKSAAGANGPKAWLGDFPAQVSAPLRWYGAGNTSKLPHPPRPFLEDQELAGMFYGTERPS